MYMRRLKSFSVSLAILVAGYTLGGYIEQFMPGSMFDESVASVLSADGPIDISGGASTVELITAIHNEFEKADHTVVMIIDSPGGNIMSVRLIYNELIYCKARYNKRLVVYTPNASCSGGMYLSAAADEVIVNPHALVGSIGLFIIMSKEKSLKFCSSISNKGLLEKAISPPEEYLSAKLAELEAEFYDVMIKGRKMTKEDLVYLQGRALYAGTEEASVFNIDKLMTLEEFLAYAMDKGYTKSEKVRLVELLPANMDWIKTKNEANK
jgi:protease IV